MLRCFKATILDKRGNRHAHQRIRVPTNQDTLLVSTLLYEYDVNI